MKIEKLRVEFLYDSKEDKTRILIWDSSTLKEHRKIDGHLHDTKSNKDDALKAYRRNKNNESKTTK